MYSTNTLGPDLPTGIEYIRKGAAGFGSTANDRIKQLSNHNFFVGVTGENAIASSEVWPTFIEYLPFDHIVSAITGNELHTAPVIYAFFYPNDSLNNTVTSSHTTFFVNDWVLPKTPTLVVYEDPNIVINSVSIQAENLRANSGLKTKQLAEIFSVTRTTYQNWLTGEKTPHLSHREHLLEILPLVEEVSQRLGSPSAVSNWLLTPISSGGKKPIDYLKARQYSAFRGFLLQTNTGREIFRPFIQPSRTHFERSKEDIEYGLERLRPKAWKEDAEANELETDL